jgi:hypothetical protein
MSLSHLPLCRKTLVSRRLPSFGSLTVGSNTSRTINNSSFCTFNDRSEIGPSERPIYSKQLSLYVKCAGTPEHINAFCCLARSSLKNPLQSVGVTLFQHPTMFETCQDGSNLQVGLCKKAGTGLPRFHSVAALPEAAAF